MGGLEADAENQTPRAAEAEDGLRWTQQALHQTIQDLDQQRAACADLTTRLQVTEQRLSLFDRNERASAPGQRRVTSLAEHQRRRGESPGVRPDLRPVETDILRELERRGELLRQREFELKDLAEQVTAAQQGCADLTAELHTERHERERLSLRIRELEAALAASARPRVSAAMAPQPAGHRPGYSIPDNGRVGGSHASVRVTPSAEPTSEPNTTELTVVHAEEQAAFSEAMRATVEKFGQTHYVSAAAPEPLARGRRLLAVNLLACANDPLAAVAAAAGSDDPRAFVYCTDNGRGFIFGVLNLFPHPFEADGCATQLLEQPEVPQRVLAVSEDVESMAALRQILARVQCSTSVVFDGRQAMELLPMVKPELVLIDLALPRGEGLRLVSRLRSDPKTAMVAIGLFCSKAVDAADFRLQVQRLAQSGPLAAGDVARAMVQALAPGGLASVRDGKTRKTKVVRDHQAIPLR